MWACFADLDCSWWCLLDLLCYVTLIVASVLLGSSWLPQTPGSNVCLLGRDQAESDDTVSHVVVGITCVLLPCVMILVVELVAARHGRISSQSYARSEGRSQSVLREGVLRTLPLVWQVLVGGLLTYSALQIIKYSTSEPRPHFWDTCGAATEIEVCVQGKNNNSLHSLADCENFKSGLVTLSELSDALMSFPSGHSAITFFAAVYMSSYLHYRLTSDVGSDECVSAFRRWLAVPFILWAVYVSCSRISDNRHYWWDVLGGAMLGCCSGLYTVVVMSRNFRNTVQLQDCSAGEDTAVRMNILV